MVSIRNHKGVFKIIVRVSGRLQIKAVLSCGNTPTGERIPARQDG